MISIKSSGSLMGASLFSAIAASLCCIVPVIAILAGSSSIAANLSWIEPVRPYLIGLSVIILGIAWYLKLKPAKSNDMDCNCEVKKTSFLQSKTFLGIVTVFAILMMAFPLYGRIFNPAPKTQSLALTKVDNKKQVKFIIQGMTCAGCEVEVNNELSKVSGVTAYNTSYASKSSLVTYDALKVDVKTIQAAILKTGYTVKGYEMLNSTTTTVSNVSFYEAPLVCHAAPSIGCGSKAKFMLVDFESNSDAIEGAWLNRTGTIVAVKWKAAAKQQRKTELIKEISTKYGVELSETNAPNYAKSFPDNKEWFKGKEVDKLSREEAAIIAKNTIAGYKKDGIVKPSFEKQFREDIQKIYTDLFLSISSYKDLTTEAYNKVEDQIQRAGEKYVGKGKMPHVELCKADESCEQGTKSCNKDGSCKEETKGKSCCDKN
jgi:mercuric ion transport protein